MDVEGQPHTATTTTSVLIRALQQELEAEFKSLALPVPARGSSYLVIAAHPVPQAATSASVRAVQTPLRPFSTRIITLPLALPAPGSHGVGTQRQLQTVTQGLVNVSEL